jgi:hypothetical protein
MQWLNNGDKFKIGLADTLNLETFDGVISDDVKL